MDYILHAEVIKDRRESFSGKIYKCMFKNLKDFPQDYVQGCKFERMSVQPDPSPLFSVVILHCQLTFIIGFFRPDSVIATHGLVSVLKNR